MRGLDLAIARPVLAALSFPAMKIALILISFLGLSLKSYGDTELEWTFDQGRNVAAITTRQVIRESYPILLVVHYIDDDSWAFTCGTTNKSEDLMVVGMGEVIDLDASLFSISDLPPGWSATRESINSNWVRTKDE